MYGETALSIVRDDAREELARIERHGDRTLVALDDGTTLEFDADELAAALAANEGDA